MNISKESGISGPGMLFLLAIIGSVLYVAYNVFPFYYNYYELLGLMEAEARVADEYTDQRIREVITAKIRDLNIPIKSEQSFRLNRSGKNIYMYLEYTEEFWVTIGDKDYKVYEFPFVAEVDRAY